MERLCGADDPIISAGTASHSRCRADQNIMVALIEAFCVDYLWYGRTQSLSASFSNLYDITRITCGASVCLLPFIYRHPQDPFYKGKPPSGYPRYIFVLGLALARNNRATPTKKGRALGAPLGAVESP